MFQKAFIVVGIELVLIAISFFFTPQWASENFLLILVGGTFLIITGVAIGDRWNGKSRRLTAEQISILTDKMRHSRFKPDELDVFYDKTSSEAREFASSLQGAISAAEIKSKLSTDFFQETNPIFRGVKIYHEDTSNSAELANELHEVLREFGISPERLVVQSPRELYIYVYKRQE